MAASTGRPPASPGIGRQTRFGYRLLVHPTTPSILLAASTAGLHRTADSGDTWQTVLQTREPFYDVLAHPSDPSVMYAASRTKVYRSTDAGARWSELTGGLPQSVGIARIRLAVSPARPDTLYVLYGAAFGFEIGLYRSDDRGDMFARRSASAPPPADPRKSPAVRSLEAQRAG